MISSRCFRTYEQIKTYADNYCKHEYDIQKQKEMLQEFWDEFCVRKFSLLGVNFYTHNEVAKRMWGDLDYQIWLTEREMRKHL